MSSLCHLVYCVRHKSEQWCTRASAGDLCMLIFIDLAHLFIRRRHCLSTHYSTKLFLTPSWVTGTLRECHRPFVWAPAFTRHLPRFVIMPVQPSLPGTPGVGCGGGGGGIPAGKNSLWSLWTADIAAAATTHTQKKPGLYAEVQSL